MIVAWAAEQLAHYVIGDVVPQLEYHHHGRGSGSTCGRPLLGRSELAKLHSWVYQDEEATDSQ